MSRYLRFSLLAGGLGVAALAAGGCSSAGGGLAAAAPPGSVTTTSPSAAASVSPSTHPTSGAETSQEKAAIAALQGMLRDWVAAAKTANYQDPELAHHMSGSALTQVTRHLAVEQSEGVIGLGEPSLSDLSFDQEIPVADPTEIGVVGCLNDSDWLEYTTDHTLYNDTPGGRHKTQALAEDESGTWKIVEYVSQAVGTC